MSLRARLIAGMVLIAVVLAGTAIAVTRTTERELLHQVDDLLEATGAPLRPPGRDRDGDRGYSELYVAFVSADGTTQVLSEPDLSGPDSSPELTGVDPVAVSADLRNGNFVRLEVPDADGSGRYRVLIRPEPRLNGALVLATSLDDVDDTMSRLRQVMLIGTLITLGVLAVVTFWVVRLGVRPIKRMTHTAKAIADGDLSQRVEVARSGTEAGELGEALNTMMGRIEEAFGERTRSEDKLRQFVADASHELRTPVQTIRGYGELYRMGALAAGAPLDDAMRRTEAEAVRMGSIVEDLLVLARLDQGRPMDQTPVDLARLARDTVSDARVREPGRAIDVDADTPVTVLGDPHRLTQVFTNLVNNALVHTQAPVHVRAFREGDQGVVEVRDEGSGMSPEQVERAFERFWRADPARARHRGGSGLGLAIVQSVTDAHGGEVTLHSEVGVGTTVRVALPLVPASEPGGLPPPTLGAAPH